MKMNMNRLSLVVFLRPVTIAIMYSS